MFARYSALLVRRPLLTKCVTSSLLYMAGDGAAQFLDGTIERHGYQPRRTLTACVWGGIIFAPIAHGWYNLVLDRLLPGTAMRQVLLKMLADQTIFGVVMNPFYLSFACMFNGGTLQDTKKLVATQTWPVLKTNWCIWPFIQVVNFKFVPPPLQVPVINVCILGWSCFLAITANSKSAAEEGNSSAEEKSVAVKK